MNPASQSPQSSDLSPQLTAELIALPQRGRWLRFLTATAGLLTACLAAAALTEQLPARYAEIGAYVTFVLLSLKEAVISIGDLLDDGKRNNSFGSTDITDIESAFQKEPGTRNQELGTKNPSTLRQWFLILLLGCLCSGCASETSTDAEISRAQLALSGARITLAVAQSQFAAMQADPKSPAWKVQATKMAVSEAQSAVETESLRLRSIMAARNVARLNAPITSAK